MGQNGKEGEKQPSRASRGQFECQCDCGGETKQESQKGDKLGGKGRAEPGDRELDQDGKQRELRLLVHGEHPVATDAMGVGIGDDAREIDQGVSVKALIGAQDQPEAEKPQGQRGFKQRSLRFDLGVAVEKGCRFRVQGHRLSGR
ncbi:hypothetical protein [Rhodoblastus sp.]|uniref:hypothetical protein n=1 Tax=Rhodoblastus sp. TaxID=1962975 RepID=UPI00262D05D5|nr:hypothetical protein [Rhodoblastus sp.]